VEQRPAPSASALLPANIDDAFRLAELMARTRMVPAHLQGKPEDCFMVIEQAVRWQLSPFAVAQCTSVIQGKLMYEGKLVAAVVNARGDLAERLRYVYTGTGRDRTVNVIGRIRGEPEVRDLGEGIRLADVATSNKMWQTQPDQQLAYHGARVWARRHMPELMLGVYSPEEWDVGATSTSAPRMTMTEAYHDAVGGSEAAAKAEAHVQALARTVDVERFYKAAGEALGWDMEDADTWVRQHLNVERPLDLPRADLERMTSEIMSGSWTPAGPQSIPPRAPVASTTARDIEPPAGPAGAPPNTDNGAKMTEKTRKGMFAALKELSKAAPGLGLETPEGCREWISVQLKRNVASRADLTEAEGKEISAYARKEADRLFSAGNNEPPPF
jgi:hypothetical protein